MALRMEDDGTMGGWMAHATDSYAGLHYLMDIKKDETTNTKRMIMYRYVFKHFQYSLELPVAVSLFTSILW